MEKIGKQTKLIGWYPQLQKKVEAYSIQDEKQKNKTERSADSLWFYLCIFILNFQVVKYLHISYQIWNSFFD